jgi:hypothetical protein
LIQRNENADANAENDNAKKCVNGRAKLDTRNTQFTHIQTISLKKHKNKLFASS